MHPHNSQNNTFDMYKSLIMFIQIGIVSQEPVLFSGTIADNIAYSDVNATQQQVRL